MAKMIFKTKKPFVAKDKGEMNSFDPLPPESYQAIIKKAENKETNKKDGNYLSVQFQITDGDYKGRIIYANLNLDNPNDTTVEIAEKELAAICTAMGIPGCEDTDDIVGGEMMIKLAVTKATLKYPAGNEIKGYKALEGIIKAPSKSGSDKKKKKAPKVSFNKTKK